MARQQFENAVEHRLRRRDITQGKEFRESTAVETRLETAELKQSLDFRSESKAVSNHPVIERLYAHTIARAEQPFGARVPDCKREHAAQMVNAVLPILFVQMEDGLGIAVGGITMAPLFQQGA